MFVFRVVFFPPKGRDRRDLSSCSTLTFFPRPSISSELDSEKRSYPGGYFDPLKFSDTTSDEALFKLKTAELKHGRLAMVGMIGIAVQATKNGEGALEALRSIGA